MTTDYLRGPFLDVNGVDFENYLESIPVQSRRFPSQEGVFKPSAFTKLAKWYHENYPFCFVCGRTDIQCHHIHGGADRSHEPTNVMMLCVKHHDQANTTKMTKGFLLWRKWVCDPENTDWCRLAVIRGRPLSELEVDEERHKQFVRAMGDAWPWPSYNLYPET